MGSSAIDERRNLERKAVIGEIREREKSYLPLLPAKVQKMGKVKEDRVEREREREGEKERLDTRMEAAVRARSKKGRGQSGRMKI